MMTNKKLSVTITGTVPVSSMYSEEHNGAALRKSIGDAAKKIPIDGIIVRITHPTPKGST